MNKKENGERNKEETVKRNDFIELKYTGYIQGKVFDSNIEEDLKTISEKAKAEETIIVVGQGMIVPGFDKDLEGKEIDKEYNVKIKADEGFGPRRRELIRTIPLASFTEKQVNPKPGMILALDNSLVKILTVSGARVITDFNNPLAGKDLEYKYKIVRKIEDDNPKAKTLFAVFFRFIPEFEVKDKIIVRGPKPLEFAVNIYKDKFKELIGKDLEFQLKEEKENDKKDPKENKSSKN